MSSGDTENAKTSTEDYRPDRGEHRPTDGFDDQRPEAVVSFSDRLLDKVSGTWFGTLLNESLVQRVDRDHRQTDREFARRRLVAGITLVIGASILAWSMATEPGDPRFIWLTIALAAVWTAGSFASGPLHAGYIMRNEKLERPILQPLLLGLIAAGVFVAGALLVAQVPFLTDAVESVLVHARNNPLWVIVFITIINGLSEELFFRGALFAAIGVRHPVAISTVVYGLATVATLNVMLVFAALILGFVVGLQRRVTGGVQASMITHITWSLTMLLVLPPLFDVLAA